MAAPRFAGRSGSAAAGPRFFTDEGLEVPAVTAAQMRELDRLAVEETGPNLFQMMENAGRSLASTALDLLESGWKDATLVVLAGTGGNGGGGICAARHLANRGARVFLCITHPDRLGPVPAFQLEVFRRTAGAELSPEELERVRPDIVLDALLGYGLMGAAGGVVERLIRWANASGSPIIALDIPSGVDATTGEAAGVRIRPTTTMTLALPKTGLRSELTGELVLADLGIPEGAYRRLGLQHRSPFGRRFRVPLTARDGGEPA